MELPTHNVSSLVKKLEEKGMVLWTHDDNGTYITLTEFGKNAVNQQLALLKDFYGAAMDRKHGTLHTEPLVMIQRKYIFLKATLV